MRMLGGLIAALVLTGTAGAQSQPAAPVEKSDDGERIMCRTLEQTGTRVSRKRVCKTRNEWRQEEQASRKHLEDAQREVNRY